MQNQKQTKQCHECKCDILKTNYARHCYSIKHIDNELEIMRIRIHHEEMEEARRQALEEPFYLPEFIDASIFGVGKE